MQGGMTVAALVAAGLLVACSSRTDSTTSTDAGGSGDARSGAGGAPGGSGGAVGGSGGAAGSGGSSGSAGTGGRSSGPADASDDASDASDASTPRAYADETNTGPRLDACPGGALKKYTGNGDYRPESGEVVSCMEFDDASIYVAQDVSNVTIENCRFVTTSDTFLNVQGSHVTITDCRFEGPAGTWIRNSYNGDHLVVRRSEFTGMANAVEFNVGYEVLEGNYVHDFGSVAADQHADGLQTDGSSHFVVRDNTVLLNDVAGATGAISVFGDGASEDVLVEHNKVAGGGYTVYPGGPKYTNVRFIDNCFSTLFYPGKAQSGAYGPWYPSSNPPGLVRTGNTWCDGPNAGAALDDNP